MTPSPRYISKALKDIRYIASSTSHPRVPTGAAGVDELLGGGLAQGALHEVFAAAPASASTAAGFTLALAQRAARQASHDRPVLIVRQDFLDTETGHLNAAGLRDMGLEPARLVLVRAPDVEAALRAAEQGVRCAALGAVVLELWGQSKRLDLTASRRLSLAAGKSAVPLFMLRVGAPPQPSAASTRWQVTAQPSRALEANAPGHPSFAVSLLRHRGGAAGHAWSLEWDRDQQCFHERPRVAAAPLPRTVVAFPVHRPAEAGAVQAFLRRTG